MLTLAQGPESSTSLLLWFGGIEKEFHEQLGLGHDPSYLEWEREPASWLRQSFQRL